MDSGCPSGDHIKPENRPDWLAPRDNKNVSNYEQYCQDLQTIPQDMPQNVKEVRILGNPITSLRTTEFSMLSECVIMDLSLNEINELQAGAFQGLNALEKLTLFGNKLTQIMPGVFDGLPALRQLNVSTNFIKTVLQGAFDLSRLPALKQLTLQSNDLTTLKQNVFGNVNTQHKLELILSQNSMKCICRSLCWIKQAEKHGWLSWWDGDKHAPECSNYPNTTWSSVNLYCDDQGELHLG